MEEEEEIEAQILEPFQLYFSDLLTLSSSTLSSSSSSSSTEERERLESISRAVMETLGPSGLGLLSIIGVPKAPELRRLLLPLARKLALLNNQDRRRILKEHNLGSDVSLKNPDRNVSSFAQQLQYAQDTRPDLTLVGSVNMGANKLDRHLDADRFDELKDNEFKDLGNIFKELGICMMKLGLMVARVCDRVIGGQELEDTILESCTAKGRLIHYHSNQDNLILKEAGRTKRRSKKLASYHITPHHGSRESELCDMDKQAPVESLMQETCRKEVRSCRTSLTNLWQQWHYDYGVFTVLTAPLFTSTCYQPITNKKFTPCSSGEGEIPPPYGHTYLQIFDPKQNGIFLVKTLADSFIVQVGESADILSKGNLHSTLHSVCRPINLEKLSRETFVVFLQPAWNKTFSISESHKVTSILDGHCSTLCAKDVHSNSDSIDLHQHEQQLPNIYHKINSVIPSLSTRLKNGMTFAEFSRETTKQYYGSSGTQSK